MAFVNLVLLASLLRRQGSEAQAVSEAFTNYLGLGAVAIAVVQLTIYNAGFHRFAHYFEFLFAIISSFVTFWFCIDNRSTAEEEVLCIMYGSHRDCTNCNVRHTTKAAEAVGMRHSLYAATVARDL